MYLALSAIWLAMVVWLLSRALRQRRVFPQLKACAARAAGQAAQVAVIVPARDESANIGACLTSLLCQRLPMNQLRIVVVDDHSRDGTAQIVERLAACDARIVLLRSPSLPAGWTGKVHACWIGARAVPPDTKWLCFLDADMRAQPLLLPSAIAAAESEGTDLLTLAPRHDLRSFAERLILPCGLYLLAFSRDLSKVQADDSADAVATGQFMLIRRAAYDKVGGYALVCNSICEDVALARLFKRNGYRVRMQDGSSFLSTRMYTGWRTLWPGVARNLSGMLGGPARTIVTAAAAVSMAWAAVLLPIVDGSACTQGSRDACMALAPAALGTAAAFALHVAGAAHFGIPFWYGFLFPVGYSVGALIALDSVRWRLTGGMRWKGRVYQ